MRHVILSGILFSMLALPACYYFGPCIDGSGPVVIESRDIAGFSGVVNTGSFEVLVSESDSFYVEVEARESLLPVIETYVTGYALMIQTRNGTCFRTGTPVTVYVGMPEVDLLKLTGSGKIQAGMASSQVVECENTGSGFVAVDSVYAGSFIASNTGSGTVRADGGFADEITLLQSGSGSIDGGGLYLTGDAEIRQSSSGRTRAVLLNANRVNAKMSGSGLVEIYGDAETADYTLTSSGRIDALDLVVSEAIATNTGSGKLFVYAVDFLEATITGSGDIIYRGDPMISYRVTGSGDVRPY